MVSQLKQSALATMQFMNAYTIFKKPEYSQGPIYTYTRYQHQANYKSNFVKGAYDREEKKNNVNKKKDRDREWSDGETEMV